MSLSLISGGLSLQQLEAGLRFPSQRLRLGHGGKHQILATRPDKGHQTRAWLFSFAEKNSTKIQSTEASKVFIRRKIGYSMCK